MTATDEPAGPGPSAGVDEQLLLRLLTQVQQLNERVQRLESLGASVLAPDPSVPSQEDLLEVQLHSARVAAELSRVTVELRAEIASVSDQAALGTEVTSGAEDEHSERDAEVIDLTANHPSGRRRSSGWVPEPVPHNRRHTDPK